MQEGKLLGHLVWDDGIRIDPERVKAILKISFPRSKKDVQSFIGKINFMCWFIPNFAKTIKHITTMLKKYQEVKWIAIGQEFTWEDKASSYRSTGASEP